MTDSRLTEPGRTDGDRIPVGDGSWQLWRHFVLRGAGFPLADLTAALADSSADCPDFDWHSSMASSIGRAVELADDDRLRQALLWQNPAVLDLCVAWLARNADRPQNRIQRRRNSERTVIKYLQRYHSKNDSVGHFGPVTWGTIESSGPAMSLVPGPGLLRRRHSYFEDWAIAAVARTFAAEPELAAELPPALAFGVSRVGPALASPDGTFVRLSPEQADLVDLADGTRRLRDIAALLGQTPDAAASLIEDLAEAGLMTRDFIVPPQLSCDDALLAQLEDLLPLSAAFKAIDQLAGLRAARDAADTATTAPELASALEMLDEQFTAIAQTSASRPRNEQPRGRRLLVPQAERDLSISIGPGLIADLGEPLGLVLASARWLSYRAGAVFDQVAEQIYQSLAPLYAAAVPLSALCGRLLPALRTDSWLDELIGELHVRWAAVLGPDPAGTRRTRLRSAEIADAVRQQFASPAPGWHAGRHHSPDLMIAAQSAAAIAAGDYEFVLGELHVGMVTADHSAFMPVAPDPDVVRRCADLALLDDQPRFVLLHVRAPGSPISGFDYPPPEAFSPAYTYISFGERLPERAVPGPRVLATDIAVLRAGEPGQGGLLAVFPDGSRYPLLQVLGEYVSYALVSRFTILPPTAHTPRLTIDRLVIAREAWRVPRRQLRVLGKMPEAEGYAELRRLAAELGLPRHTYWRPVRQAKPIYLDLCSPQLAAMLLHAARAPQATSEDSDVITFSEMHPRPDQLWLADASDGRYTSELRLTIADTLLPDSGPGPMASQACGPGRGQAQRTEVPR